MAFIPDIRCWVAACCALCFAASSFGQDVSKLSLSPSRVLATHHSTGTVEISAPAPQGGYRVTLSSEHPAYVVVPGSITIPQGSSSGSFSISTEPFRNLYTNVIRAIHGTSGAKATLTVEPLVADPNWSKFRGNPLNTGVKGGSGSTGLMKWSYDMKGVSWSSAAIGADGTIYLGGGPSSVFAFNPNGTKKWEFVTGAQVMSSPAIGSDGTVYIGSEDGDFYAINPNGTKKWAFLTGGQIQSSPAIAPDGTIYIGSYDGNLYALNPDGTEKWAFPTGGQVFPSPAIATDGTIYLASGGTVSLYAINPNGSQKWAVGTDGTDFQTPAIGSNGTIYVSSNDGALFAVSSTGNVLWKYQMAGGSGSLVVSSPAVGADGTIYVGTFASWDVFAINPNGTLKWSFATDGYVQSSPAIGSDGTIYFGSNGHAYALDPNGNAKWTFSPNGMPSSPAIGPDGTIYLTASDGKLYAIK